MSKNIKGKNIDINLNITQSGTFNADIFNAYTDFTLDGVSVVNRIATNEADIEILKTSKQDNLVIQQTISPSSTAIASSDAIIAYVAGSTPTLSATAPLNYDDGVISGTFDLVPTNGSLNFLTSNSIYDALQLKQPLITSATNLVCNNLNNQVITTDNSITAINGSITSIFGNIISSTGFLKAPTIIQGTTNLLDTINTKQDVLTIQQTISPSSTAIASSDAIIAYVAGSTPTLSATAPLNYDAGVISATFDTAPTNGSLNFLTSNTIYNKLLLYQPLINEFITLDCGYLSSGTLVSRGQITSVLGLSTQNGIIESINGTIKAPTIIQGTTNLLNEINTKQNIITSSTNLTINNLTTSGTISSGGNITTSTGNIVTSLGSITAPTIIQGTTNLLTAINNLTAEVATKQPQITEFTSLTTGGLNTNGPININDNTLSNTLGTLYLNGQSGQILSSSIQAETQIVSNGTISASNNIVSNTNIIANGNIIGNIFNNIVAGSGITLTENSPLIGQTLIEATGGLSTSTQYAFQATSNLNSNQSISFGVSVMFNQIELCVPSTSAYNTANYRYTCPVAGIYTFGFKGFINTINDNFRMAIYKNGGDVLGMGGAGSQASEAFDVIEQMAAGDSVYISCVTGSALIYMAAQHTWWYGYLLQPINNSVSATTDLSIASLSSSGDIITGTGNIVTTSGDITTTSGNITGADIIATKTITGNIFNTLSAGYGITLEEDTPTAGITQISTLPLISKIYSRGKTQLDAPTGTELYTNFNVLDQNSIYCNWVAPDINSVVPNTGIIILISGMYKLDYTFNAYNNAYNNRVNWFSRILVNGADNTSKRTFIYTRGDQTSFSQYGSSSTSYVKYFSAGDYLLLKTTCAKNSPVHNNDFTGLRGDIGSTITLQYLD